MARHVAEVTIAAGASVSGEFPTNNWEIVGIVLPPRWTPAGISFQAQAVNSAYPKDTFLAVVDSAAAAVTLSDPTSAGTNQVTTLTETGTPTGGTFKLTVGGQETSALNFNATAAEVKTALAALSTVGGAGNLDTAGGALDSAPITITWKAALMEQLVTVTVTSPALTGGTAPVVTPTISTPFVAATVRYVAVANSAKALRDLGRAKIVSGTNASQVNQTEARVIGVVLDSND